MSSWNSRLPSYAATLGLLVGLVFVAVAVLDQTEEPRAASPRTTPMPETLDVGTDAFLAFQCEGAFEICAQQIAENYCRQRLGTLLWWRAKPDVVTDGPGHSFRLTEINCKQ